MGRSLLNRVVAAVVLCLAALPMLAGTTAAATIIEGCDGTCGAWTVGDENGGPQGAVCVYEKPGYDLDLIRIKPPTAYGPRATMSVVRWRFIIRRDPNHTGDSFTNYFTSSWQKAKASTTKAARAGHGFSVRTWVAPENPHGFFDVFVELQWRRNGAREGGALANLEYFKAKRGTASHISELWCLEDF